jgi:hypothetical protein
MAWSVGLIERVEVIPGSGWAGKMVLGSRAHSGGKTMGESPVEQRRAGVCFYVHYGIDIQGNEKPYQHPAAGR